MKKGIYILSGLIIIFSILCLIKDKRKENLSIKNNNPYEIFSFYKEENLNRYKKYFNNNNLS